MKRSLALQIAASLFFALSNSILLAQQPAQNASSLPSPVIMTAQQDHQRMMELLKITSIRQGADGRNPNAPNAANYDEAKANPYPNLPDPLTLKNGKKVTTAKLWWDQRRAEIVEEFDREIYGRVPKNTPKVNWQVVSTTNEVKYDTPVITKQLVGQVDNSSYPLISVTIQLTLTTPAKATGAVPVVMEFGFGPRPGNAPAGPPPNSPPPGPPWQQQLLAKGWGYAIIVPTSIQADNGAGLTQGIIGLCNKGQPRKVDDWGALRAWAWGASRALDYFETDKSVDAKQIGIEGLSRYGKATIVTMAYDPRFAIAFVGSSGEGGVKLHRRNFGELVENVAGSGEYHWMAGNFIKYAGPLTWNDLPVDSHELVALCAPRPVFVSVGSPQVEGQWVDAKGMFMATVAAGPVYRLLGKKDLGAVEMPPMETSLIDGDLAFRQHSGGHTTGPNWPTFLTFASRYIKGKPVPAALPATGLQQKPVGQFEHHEDVGQVATPGSVIYSPEKQTYRISASGTNMWAGKDEFHFAWKRLKGNFILRTRAEFVGKGVDPHRKIGWIIRPSLDTDSPHVNASLHGDGLTSLQFRRTKGAITEGLNFTAKGQDVIQLERQGGTYIMSVARFGEVFTTQQISDVALGDEVYVGLYVCSHNNSVVETAVFRDVEITIPARENFVPYREYIGSNLEVMDVATAERKVLYRVKDSLQAPNWTTDGKALIYNHNGLLYRFDLARNTPTLFDTGEVKRNNNDHVLSFDGKMLGISSSSQEDGNVSMIYTLPMTGGKPVKITRKGPSYLHGWSPDKKFLIYTGSRDGELDIYKIPATGGEEIRLTTAKGVDDGSEYTPDGKYIYFNSFRSGTMQIWRMKPDGSEQTQITNDEYNNWFPHISPDGKWIVFITFPKDIAPGDHPFYKQVYLRLMPMAGGAAKVIAYLYGGQGTINVPSWSPDSKKIAFVSNTDMKQ
jgi:TolB protein